MATKKTAPIGPLLGEVSQPDTVAERQRFGGELLARSSDEVLRTHGGGDLALYDRLLTDGQVHSVFGQRRAATISRPWVVEPGGSTPLDIAAADDLRSQLKSVEFDRVSSHLLLAIIHGFSLAECIWTLRGSRIVLSRMKTRKARRFGFSASGALLMLRPEMRPMPPRKFWVWRFGGDDDDRNGRGLGEPLYWPVWFKRNALRFWSIWLERNASPTPVAKGPAGMNPIDEAKLLELLGHVTNGGRIVIPKHVEIAFLESARQAGGDYQAFVDYWDAQITKILMSQTMTTEDGASLSQAKVHQDVGQSVTASDADLLCESFTRGPATWLTEWNFPGAKVPLVYRDTTDEEDLNTHSERDLKLSQMGYRPTAKRIAEVYGDGYELAPAPAPQAAPANFAEPKTLPEVEPTAEDLGGDWREALGAEVDEIDNLLKSASSLEEARDRLGELMKREPKALTESIARRRFAARIIGEGER